MAKPKRKTEEELAEEERQWDSLEAWAREEEARRQAAIDEYEAPWSGEVNGNWPSIR